ncbi:MAG TPA: alpha/beta hydrolase [Synechococcales cyanobacterium M55_K2018_004]|nr:alpha/beta hydrolase [Synechococcales cyanobacterium M55_K2018_004]
MEYLDKAMFLLWRVLRLLLLVYGAMVIYAYFMADSKIFLPPPPTYEDTPEILKLVSGDRYRISALYLQNPQASYTILYSHGNATDLGQLRFVLEGLRQAGFNVFAYDYRGYGTSEGRPTEQGSYQDIQAAYRYLTEEQAIAPERLILLGQSVGGGPSTYLASHYPVAGLILESTFVSIFRVVFPFPIFPFDKFPNLRRIPQVDCPVFVIHGVLDATIPLWHGQALYAAALEPKQSWWVEGADHNNLMVVAGEARYYRAIANFAQSVSHTNSVGD